MRYGGRRRGLCGQYSPSMGPSDSTRPASEDSVSSPSSTVLAESLSSRFFPYSQPTNESTTMSPRAVPTTSCSWLSAMLIGLYSGVAKPLKSAGRLAILASAPGASRDGGPSASSDQAPVIGWMVAETSTLGSNSEAGVSGSLSVSAVSVGEPAFRRLTRSWYAERNIWTGACQQP